MIHRAVRVLASAALPFAVLLAATACSSGGSGDKGSSGTALVGTFRLSAGSCSASGATGTYFRMITPGGTIEKGKYFGNPDSACADKSITVLTPGADGGLVTGGFQAGPAKPFDAGGNALASRIVAPAGFSAIKFGISTAGTDPQTGKKVDAPQISVKDGKLSGRISAWSAAWNNLYFNQGSPKPDGSSPGLTAPLSGSYDAATHAFEITWASQIVGGPFNGFTGYWHLQGTFTPTATPAS